MFTLFVAVPRSSAEAGYRSVRHASSTRSLSCGQSNMTVALAPLAAMSLISTARLLETVAQAPMTACPFFTVALMMW